MRDLRSAFLELPARSPTCCPPYSAMLAGRPCAPNVRGPPLTESSERSCYPDSPLCGGPIGARFAGRMTNRGVHNSWSSVASPHFLAGRSTTSSSTRLLRLKTFSPSSGQERFPIHDEMDPLMQQHSAAQLACRVSRQRTRLASCPHVYQASGTSLPSCSFPTIAVPSKCFARFVHPGTTRFGLVQRTFSLVSYR